MSIQKAFELAVQHHRSGRLADAEALYRQILAVVPRHADALHMLGVMAGQAGRNDAAIELIRQAIALAPGVPHFYCNLGEACRAAGLLDDAIAVYRQAIALKPDNAVAHGALGGALYMKGHLNEAIAAYRKAIVINPDHAEAHNNLGTALHEKGCLNEAIDAYRKATIIKPDFAMAHSNLGNTLRERGEIDEAVAACRQAIAVNPECAENHNNLAITLTVNGLLDEAVAALRQAIALKPDYAEAHNNLGTALHQKGCLNEASDAYRKATIIKPDFAMAHSNLGNTLRERGEIDEAVAACRQATALKPDYAENHNNLAIALTVKGQFDEAIAAFSQAIALKHDYAEAHGNLANALKDMGRLDEAIAAYRQAIALKSDYASAHSNLLFCMNYQPGMAASALAEEHRRWNSQHGEPLRVSILPHANERSPDRRLRIGYVSPDFREHSVAFFLEGLLENHDRAQVELFCYSDVPNPDAVTARIRQLAGHWRSITGMPDSELADLIRSDGIDILVDLAGHTGKNRLPVFARKPAPVQVTWLGYPNTTGLEVMNYRITDSFADPPGSTEDFHTEQLVRLPRSAWCYRPFERSPPVGALPIHDAGQITFGCFNAMPKINGALLELWAKMLLAVPGSRLLLKNSALGEPLVRQGVMTALEKSGIGRKRLELVGRIPDIDGHLASYGRVDIALDTFPYHGTTTTCEALWMGVPVVTMAGKTHVSRVGVSLLGNLDLAEMIAHSPERYVQLAVDLANDLPRLAELRSTLRDRMRTSPLMDAAGFARDMEAAYREMWHKWCASSNVHT